MKMKYPPPKSKNWAFWSWIDIPSKKTPGEVYLRRLRILQTPWFAFYLHFINEADFDRDAHDHPWTFWSWVLRGGYVEKISRKFVVPPEGREVVLPFTQAWKRWSVHKMRVTDAHQITEVWPGTMTFVVTGRRRRNWGFWTPDGFVVWTRYLKTQFAAEDLAPEA